MINDKLSLQELANALSEKQGIYKKDAELFVKELFDLVEEALANEKYVKIKGLGVFKLIEVDSRESINVNTGERIEIQGHSKVSFTPETSLKELINKPFAHFETVILNEGTVLEDTQVEVDVINEEKKEESVEKEIETQTISTEKDITEEIEINSEEKVELIVEEAIVEEEAIEETETVEIPLVKEEEVKESNTTESISTEDVIIVDEVAVEQKEEVVVEQSIESTEDAIELKVVKQEEPPQEKTSKPLIIITILLVIIIILGAYWLFRPTDETIEKPIIKPVVEITETITDSITINEVEEKLNTQSEEIGTSVVKPVKDEKVASIADTTDYHIIGTQTTHIIQNGETLIRVALKYFGSKDYWPYIAKHNKNIIKDVNNVPIGTELNIPKLSPKK
jgi:nucleoid DNA-binding protein